MSHLMTSDQENVREKIAKMFIRYNNIILQMLTQVMKYEYSVMKKNEICLSGIATTRKTASPRSQQVERNKRA